MMLGRQRQRRQRQRRGGGGGRGGSDNNGRHPLGSPRLCVRTFESRVPHSSNPWCGNMPAAQGVFVSGYYVVGQRGDGGVVIGGGRRRGVRVGGGESGDDDDGEAEEEAEEEEEIGGDDNDLGQGKVWAKLTDGAKDAGANTGGNGSLVDVMNEGGDEMETMLTDGDKKGGAAAGGGGGYYMLVG